MPVLDYKDIIAKRDIEIKVLEAQLDGVQKKIENLSKTRTDLEKGLERAKASRSRLLELAKDENN